MEDDSKEINGKPRREIKLTLQVNCIIFHHDLLELIRWAFLYGESNESNCSSKLGCLHCLENRPIITQGMSLEKTRPLSSLMIIHLPEGGTSVLI